MATLHHLRQQTEKPNGKPNLSLADFIAPADSGASGLHRWLLCHYRPRRGRTGREFEADHDDYNSIMLKALADRLAESFAEYLHRLVRTELWGYDRRKH